MKFPARIAALAFISLKSLSADAQFQGEVFKTDTTFKVFANSQERNLAFCGGFNTPQFAMADLNGDGKQDLVVLEGNIGQLRTFINFGTAGNPDYRYRPKYEQNFPSIIASFIKLKDYNCDGIPDLFDRGVSGFEVFKGSYNASNELTFSYFKDLWYQNSIGWTNAYTNPQDIPEVADVDGDGDLDFFGHDIWGGNTINWYKNMQVEDGLPCDSIRIKHDDACWGKIFQNIERTHILNYSCLPPFMQNPGSGNDNSNPGAAAKTTLHTGNTICLFDHDGDGDLDYLNGNISFSELQFLENGRADYGAPRDSMIAQDTTWQSGGHLLEMHSWPAAFYLDVDQDGKSDILASPHADNASENYNCIAFYRNTGSQSSPVFTYQSDSFLVDRSIDLGTGSYPMIYDYNKDGKPDLFVGGDGVYQGNNTLRARIVYYKNVSNGTSHSFVLENNDFLSVETINTRGAYPAVGDLDNDGKDDLVVGHADGSISFYKNAASSGTVQPLWLQTVDTLRDVNGVKIDSTQFPAPFIYDIDKDGREDLILGGSVGWLYYYKNTGNSGELKLTYQTSKLGMAKADPFNLFSGYSAPFIGKMDNTGTDYLLVGSNSGRLSRYTGFQTGNVTNPYQRIDSAYSNINSDEMKKWYGVRTVPAVADLDGDGKYEMVVGNVLGGVRIYKQSMMVGIDEVAGADQNIQVYPNPAKETVYLSWTQDFVDGKTVVVDLYAITGQKQLSRTVTGANTAELSVSHLAAGTYICTLNSGNNRRQTKLVIMK